MTKSDILTLYSFKDAGGAGMIQSSGLIIMGLGILFIIGYFIYVRRHPADGGDSSDDDDDDDHFDYSRE